MAARAEFIIVPNMPMASMRKRCPAFSDALYYLPAMGIFLVLYQFHGPQAGSRISPARSDKRARVLPSADTVARMPRPLTWVA